MSWSSGEQEDRLAPLAATVPTEHDQTECKLPSMRVAVVFRNGNAAALGRLSCNRAGAQRRLSMYLSVGCEHERACGETEHSYDVQSESSCGTAVSPGTLGMPSNVALQRLAHATTNKGHSPASPLQALVRRGVSVRAIGHI